MKKRVILNFPAGIVSKPLTYQLIKHYDIIINILQAKIFPEEDGQLILELENEKEVHLNEGIKYLEKEGVDVRVLEESIIYDQQNCINCGACTGVCKNGALTMDQQTWELTVDQERCLLCEMCITVCPVRALSLEY